MGHHQPVYVLRNLDREHGLRYVLSSPGAGKRGQLTARGEGRDSVWFVGTGSFPNPATVRAEYEIGGASGSVVAPEVDAAYCTYAVRPIVRWLDADFDDVMPTAEQVAGWSLTLEGALGSLDCTWNGAGLTCGYAAKEDGPLPEGTYYSLGRETELRVPASATPPSPSVRRPTPRPSGSPAASVTPCSPTSVTGSTSRASTMGGLVLPRPPPGRHRLRAVTVTFESVDPGRPRSGHLDMRGPTRRRWFLRPPSRSQEHPEVRRAERQRPSRCRRPVAHRWVLSVSAWRCSCSG